MTGAITQLRAWGVFTGMPYGDFGLKIPSDPPGPNKTGIEFRPENNRLHFRTDPSRLHFRPETGRLHLRPETIK